MSAVAGRLNQPVAQWRPDSEMDAQAPTMAWCGWGGPQTLTSGIALCIQSPINSGCVQVEPDRRCEQAQGDDDGSSDDPSPAAAGAVAPVGIRRTDRPDRRR